MRFNTEIRTNLSFSLCFSLFVPLCASVLNLLLLAGCVPPPRDELSPHIGKVARVYVASDIDPASAARQWLEDIELIRLKKQNGRQMVLLRFVRMQPASGKGGAPPEIWFAVDQILEVEVDGKVVYARQ